ncbi:MAG: hypothetical protein JW789_00245 [Candidatus Aenigmarchaeota archaeon]|nr:hypothetical protein [Candidatus Aenigmarchaeota archaeon]
MKVNGNPLIEGSYEAAAEMIENALLEREEMGLGIPDTSGLKVNLELASLKGCRGHLETDNMTVYAFNIARDDLYREHCHEVDVIDTFIRNLGKLSMNNRKLEVSAVLDDPEKALEDYERNMGYLKMKKFRESEEFLYDYDTVRNTIITRAADVRDIVKGITPEMMDVFMRKGHKTMRHELDHVELSQNSAIAKRHKMAIDAAKETEVDYAMKGKPADDIYRDAQRKLLNSLLEFDPLSEIRALFFSVVDPGEWKSTDFDRVSREVLGIYDKGYIWKGTGRDVMADLAKSLNGESITEKDLIHIMNRNTHYRTDDFNRDNVFRFLNMEFPMAMERLKDNAYRAADAIGTAYRDDPSRFVRAAKAGLFNRYLLACEGVS